MEFRSESYVNGSDSVTVEAQNSKSGLEHSSHAQLSTCTECVGKTPLQQSECLSCKGATKFLTIQLEHYPLSQEDRDSEFCIFQEELNGKSLADGIGAGEVTEVKGGMGGTLPGSSEGSGKGQNKSGEEEAGKKKKNWLMWLLRLLLLLLLLYLLTNGLDFLRKKLVKRTDAKKEEVKKEEPKKKTVKKEEKVPKKALTDQGPRQKRGHGDMYQFAPIEVWKHYGDMSYRVLSANRGLNNFIKTKLKKGKLAENRKLMSEKGVFHVCNDFGKYAQACRDEWFKNRKVRQTFVDKVEEIYKREGDNVFE
jgi:hypothetical protein